MFTSRCSFWPHFLLMIFSLTSLVSSAQNGAMSIVPPSPNVASLGKYGAVPVSTYTGIPNISIPLYEVQIGTLKLPITISYHAGGVKVEEIASSVGLGWSLNAGGVISRSVQGLPDEAHYWNSQPINKRIETYKLNYDGNYVVMDSIARNVEYGFIDGEPDMYFFNFGPYTGKYIYDQAGKIHTIPTKRLEFIDLGTGWKVIGEDGTIYTFNNTEHTGISVGSFDQEVVSAWQVSSIQSADGVHSINFTYENVSYVTYSLSEETKYFAQNGVGECLQTPQTMTASNLHRTQRLTRIDFEEGYLKFIYNNPRCDLDGDKSLDLLEVYTKDQSLVKRFTFNYGYFGDNSDGCQYLTAPKKRLKLLSVMEQGPTENKPPHKFEYNESINLPSRTSYAQDHWGYFNGKLYNSGLVSNAPYVVYSGVYLLPEGADRRTDPTSAQAAILKKIIYPTGGETLFTYESNMVNDDRVEPETFVQYLDLSQPQDNLILHMPVPFESDSKVVPVSGARVTIHASGLDSQLWSGCDIVECFVIKDDDVVHPFRKITSLTNGSTELWPQGSYKLRLNTECSNSSTAEFSVSISMESTEVVSSSQRAVGGLRIKQIEDRGMIGTAPMITSYRYTLPSDSSKSSGTLTNFPVYDYLLNVSKLLLDDFGYPAGPPPIECVYVVRKSSSCYPLATTMGSYVGYSYVVEDHGTNGETHYEYTAYPDGVNPVFPFPPIESFDWRRGALVSRKDYVRQGSELKLAKEQTNSWSSFNEYTTYGLKVGRDRIDINMPPLVIPVAPKYAFYPILTEFYYLSGSNEKFFDVDDPTKFSEKFTSYTYSPIHLQSIQTTINTSFSNVTTSDQIVSTRKYPFDFTFTGTPSGDAALGIKKLQDQKISSAVVEEFATRQSVSSGQISNQRIISGAVNIYFPNRPYVAQQFRLEMPLTIPVANFGVGSSLSNNAFQMNSNYKVSVDLLDYDIKGNLITQRKVSDVQTSYIWENSMFMPIAAVSNADPASIAHTSFENGSSEGGFLFNLVPSPESKTGVACHNVGSANLIRNGLNISNTYVLSYWAKSGIPIVSAGVITSNDMNSQGDDGWRYFEKIISGVSSVTISGPPGTLIDEVRMYPKGATMTTFTHVPLIGLRSKTDQNSRTTYYEYDLTGRLSLIRDHNRNIVKRYKYHILQEEDYNH